MHQKDKPSKNDFEFQQDFYADAQKDPAVWNKVSPRQINEYNEAFVGYIDNSLETINEFALDYLIELNQLMDEVERRESLTHKLYSPLPFQEKYHQSTARTVILAKGNRAGGSVCGFMEDGRAILNEDPYQKWPSNGTLVCLGFGESHIANVIYPMLFSPGMFDIIRDKKTGKWRTFRNWFEDDEVAERTGLEGDRGREEESELSQPLITPNLIKSKTWVNKGMRVFKEIVVETQKSRWVVIAANSNGDPRHMQGYNLDKLHIDEDLANPGWFDEQRARLVKRKGKIRWTAMPHGDNNCLQQLQDRATQQQLIEEETGVLADTVSITASIRDNPYLPQEEIEAFCQDMWAQGQDVYDQRVRGIYNSTNILVYDRWNERTHNVRIISEERTPAQEAYCENGFYPLPNWTIFCAIDPGYKIFAALLAAIPPPELGSQLFIFDEVYVRKADAETFSNALKKVVKSLRVEAWIIDSHGANLTNSTNGISPRIIYREAFRRANLQSIRTGYDFWDGYSDRQGRIAATRERFAVREGIPGLLIDNVRCPNLVMELPNFKKKKRHGIIQGEADRSGDSHAIDCMEYLCSEKRVEYIHGSGVEIEKNLYDLYLEEIRDNDIRHFRVPKESHEVDSIPW